MNSVILDNVQKRYGEDVEAVKGVSLTIASGEFMVFVGPSGCGKTTLLRMIAGLESVSAGRVEIGDRDVTSISPRDRDVAMVFQDYALYPHMTVRQNLEYGLRARKVEKRARQERVLEVAQMLGLADLLERHPGALSGGQRQRVAIGRAIARQPTVYLMDEPLSNLDAKLRVGMRSELKRLHEALGVTTIYVTHDQVEAMTLGDRVAVMRDGLIQQVGSPRELYASPTNLFVATFLGSPPMNTALGTVRGDLVDMGSLRLPVAAPPGVAEGAPVVVGMRPSVFSEVGTRDGDAPSVEVEVAVVEELGEEQYVLFPVEAAPAPANAAAFERDDDTTATLLAGASTLFTARISPGTEVHVGERLTLYVDCDEIQFFDVESGVRLSSGPSRELQV